jgi:hypothetical protein
MQINDGKYEELFAFGGRSLVFPMDSGISFDSKMN